MNNYDILYQLLDCNDIIEYTIMTQNNEELKTNLTKSQAYDYLLANNLKIVNISIDPFYNFVLYVIEQ